MVSHTRSTAVLELGRRLIARLEADDDLLASWMAHHIADLMEVAKNGPEESKTAANEACATAILELWDHRSTLPIHLRPLGDIEPVVRTLAALDVDQTDYRFHSRALREAATTETDSETKQWLDLALGLDWTARKLIQFALRHAAENTVSTTADWVELAAQAGAEDGAEKAIVNFVGRGRQDDETDDDARDAVLNGTLSKLEAFVALTTELIEEIRGELGPEDTDDG